MSRTPSFRQLDKLGADAGKYVDAFRAELEQAEAMAADEFSRHYFRRALARLDRRHAEYFGQVAA